MVLAGIAALAWWYASGLPVMATDDLAQLHEYVLAGQREHAGALGESWPDQWEELRSILLFLGVAEQRYAPSEGKPADLSALWTPGISTHRRTAAMQRLDNIRNAEMFDATARLIAIDLAARPGLESTLYRQLTMMDPRRDLVGNIIAAQRARMHAATGDVDDARERLAALTESLALLRVYSWQGTVLDHRIASTLGTDFLVSWNNTVVDQPIADDQWLRGGDAVLAAANGRWAPLVHAIEGERFVLMHALRPMHSHTGRFLPESEPRERMLGSDAQERARLYRGPLRDSELWLERFITAATAAAGSSGNSVRTSDAALDEVYDEFAALGGAPGAKWPALKEVLHDIRIPIAEARIVRITLAGARVVLAIERYRLSHGQPPETLDELGDLLPDGLGVDPVTEQPWDYGRTDSSYTLVSRELPGYEADQQLEIDPLAGVQIAP